MRWMTLTLLAAAFSAVGTACGAGTTDNGGSATTDASATPLSVTEPLPSFPAGLTGASGDTTANAHANLACAAWVFADDNETVVAYVTVNGSNGDEAKPLCQTLNLTIFRNVSSVPPGTTAARADCYLSTSDGAVTARVFQAPMGTSATTLEVCSAMLNAARSAS